MMIEKSLGIACEAADAARSVILKGYGTMHDVDVKPDRSIVTAFDRAAEQVILDVLKVRTDHSILSEESGWKDTGSDYRWVVDPIDGTTNYSRGNPVFAVSIALLHGDEPVAGVIDLPVQKKRYAAQREGGAFLNGSRIHVSKPSRVSKSILCIEFGRAPEDGQRMAEVVRRLSPAYSLRLMGSTAFEMTWVACGRADAFISCGDKLWDYAAGLLIIREAGGRILDWRGRDWRNRSSFVLASNGHADRNLLPLLSDLQPEDPPHSGTEPRAGNPVQSP